jgi:hypothetical protein
MTEKTYNTNCEKACTDLKLRQKGRGYTQNPRLLLFVWRTANLQINNQGSDTSGINVKLKSTSQAIHFIKQILLFLAYSYGWMLYCEDYVLNLFSCDVDG